MLLFNGSLYTACIFIAYEVACAGFDSTKGGRNIFEVEL